MHERLAGVLWLPREQKHIEEADSLGDQDHIAVEDALSVDLHCEEEEQNVEQELANVAREILVYP